MQPSARTQSSRPFAPPSNTSWRIRKTGLVLSGLPGSTGVTVPQTIRAIGLARAEAQLTPANLACDFDRLLFQEHRFAKR